MPKRTGAKRRNRVGRPPASDSAETRKRILDSARVCFGRNGYDKTTNRDIAEVANITTGAIYHYFQSKQELFAETMREVQAIILEDFERAADAEASLQAKLAAILDRAVALHSMDPSLAAFASNAPVEVLRHPDLLTSLGDAVAGVHQFFHEVVDSHRDELKPGVGPADLTNLLVAATLGLAQFATITDARLHRAATEVMKQLVQGDVFLGAAAPKRADRTAGRSRRAS
jgi:AcrR family transcriptional regulator